MRTLRAVCLVSAVGLAFSVSAQQPLPQIIHSASPPPPSRATIQAPSPNLSETHTPDGAIRISGGVMAGQIVKRIWPSYLACDHYAGGVVVMHAIIGTDGKVQQLAQTYGSPGPYGKAVMDAVRQWEYKPYLLNGIPVKVDTTITVDLQRNSNGCPPATPGTARVSGGVMAGLLIKTVSPTVSSCGHGGTVVLHAIINKEGKVQPLSAISGPPELYSAVMDAVRQWQYKPYLLNGEAVNVDTTIADTVDVNGCSSNKR